MCKLLRAGVQLCDTQPKHHCDVRKGGGAPKLHPCDVTETLGPCRGTASAQYLPPQRRQAHPVVDRQWAPSLSQQRDRERVQPMAGVPCHTANVRHSATAQLALRECCLWHYCFVSNELLSTSHFHEPSSHLKIL